MKASRTIGELEHGGAAYRFLHRPQRVCRCGGGARAARSWAGWVRQLVDRRWRRREHAAGLAERRRKRRLLEEDLRREIARGRVIAVVGAGVAAAASRDASAASWVGLLEDGISRCEQVFIGLPAGWADEQRAKLHSSDVRDLLAVAEEIERVLHAPAGGEYRRWLRETVGELRPYEPAVIEALRDLGVPILTTNYDLLFEEVTGLEPVTWKDGAHVERLLRGDEPGVLHLHGHWRKPETVVLGIRSYEDVLGDEYAQFVQRAAAALHSLLFIGCGDGLDDPNFGALREWLSGVVSHAEHRHFRLALGADAAALSAEHHRLRDRIVVVPYGTEHDHLVPFLQRLRPAHAGSGRARLWLRRARERWSHLRLRWRIAVLLVVAGAIVAPFRAGAASSTWRSAPP